VPLHSDNHVLLDSEPAWDQFLVELRAFLPLAEGDVPPTALTPAEQAVLRQVAQGLDNAAIAAQLGKSEKTVRSRCRASSTAGHAQAWCGQSGC
jgi:DNA-binding NarL/FixJ family response regulator